jgi:hypothetical protein
MRVSMSGGTSRSEYGEQGLEDFTCNVDDQAEDKGEIKDTSLGGVNHPVEQQSQEEEDEKVE